MVHRFPSFSFRHNQRNAFTLIELLVVIGIIGILASVVLVAVSPKKNIISAQDAGRASSIKQLQNALYQYLVDNGAFPSAASIQEGSANALPICKKGIPNGTSSCVSLDALVPTYMVDIPLDSSEGNPNLSGYKINTQNGRALVTDTYQGQAGQIVITTGLVGYWKLDETAANGTVLDSSTNGYNGTATSFSGGYGPTTTVPSLSFSDSEALNFNGSSSIVTLPTLPSLPTFTISFWWNSESIRAWSGPFNDRVAGVSGFQLVNDSASTALFAPHLVIWSGAAETSQFISTSTYAVPFTGYHHVVWTYDGATAKFYFDGIGQNTIPDATTGFGVTGVTIGKGYGFVGGEMDDVRIYNRALNSSEVSKIAGGNG